MFVCPSPTKSPLKKTIRRSLSPLVFVNTIQGKVMIATQRWIAFPTRKYGVDVCFVVKNTMKMKILSFKLKDQSDHVLEMSNALQANMKSLEERNLILSIWSMSSRD
jgi:hypothetical protein